VGVGSLKARLAPAGARAPPGSPGLLGPGSLPRAGAD
jgi:hypothetical protein